MSSGTKGNANPLIIDDEIDRRVRKAVEKSEEAINKSPSKYKNDVLDNCIQTYIKKDPFPQDQPLLYTIAPYLSMENRFTPALRVYSNENPGVQANVQHNIAEASYLNGSVATGLTRQPDNFYESAMRDERSQILNNGAQGNYNENYESRSNVN